MRLKRFGLPVLVAVVALGLLAFTEFRRRDRRTAPAPQAAAVEFATAYQAGDIDGALQASVGDDTSARILAATMDGIAARKQLRAAAAAKFGPAAADLAVSPGPDNQILAAVEQGQMTIDGDAATLTTPDKKQVLTLKKADGRWKVDRGVLTRFGQQDLSRMLPIMTGMTAAYRDTADGIEAGKYGTVDEARRALKAQLEVAALPVLTAPPPPDFSVKTDATTAPATAPTVPTTTPTTHPAS